ncbi:hypothetical protein ACFOD1_03015 [Pseudidiomarina halophila]|uniref:DUF4760 domain-containing protein n=1 Tax=Pseudidiomarina halophila TaxID=1449799 RepID=A0A432XZ07_9GAMM|nr:hypothetical protein [Pseudidiomarina halophila]RUO53927.1 hypothetical protein CWI69_00355 [Pseudidiomarina halophila]
MQSLEVVLNPLDWDGVSAIASVLMLFINLFLLISIIFAYRTIKEEVKNRDSTLLIWAMEEMSKIKPDIHVLKDAGEYASGQLGKSTHKVKWSGELRAAAQRVSVTMQRLSYMAEADLISKEHFSNMWGPMFADAWNRLEPFVQHKRHLEREPLTLADGAYSRKDFEKFARYCEALRN